MIDVPRGEKYQPVKLESVTWIIAFFFTLVALLFPPFRYLQYLVPFLALLHGLAERHFEVQDVSKSMLLLIITGLCFSPLADADGLKDLFFITSGISISLVIKRVRFNSFYLFWLFLLGSILFALKYNGLASGIVFNLSQSKSSFEGNFAFLFGLLTVYASLTRQWKLLFYSFLASILALKRIVILAEVVCILLALLPEKRVKQFLNPVLMLSVNLIFVLIVILYATHTFDDLIALFTEQSANQFGMGRQTLYGVIANDILKDPLQFIFIGAGPGAAYVTLGEASGFNANLHSDILKIFYEYGLIVFSMFIFFGYVSRSLSQRILFLFANIIFITDNVLIYHFFLFFLCMFSMATKNYLEDDLEKISNSSP